MPKAYFIHAWPYQDDALNLPVKNVQEAVPFYVDVMNFRLVSTHKSPIVSAVLERDAITIGLAENGGDPSQEGCFFEVDNVMEAHKELALNGLTKELSPVKLDKHGETSWKLFFVIAPDGLCYSIGERQPGE
ncbi:MAG: hypothetical protein JWQ78_371 [Sediminibacterium sp.]|nr:hypothetical protein [Sediminibacterium sp.]